MINALYTFSAMSIAGTVVLALLPRGSLRRTASMVVGLLALLLWAENFLSLLHWEYTPMDSIGVLVPTSVSLSDLQREDTP